MILRTLFHGIDLEFDIRGRLTEGGFLTERILVHGRDVLPYLSARDSDALCVAAERLHLLRNCDL